METSREIRGHETAIEIAAPAAAVWRAISQPEGLTSWYCEEARVEPGVGGTMWVSWGEDEDGTSRIESWEPERHLRLTAQWAADTLVSEDYYLHEQGDRTTLRVVHAGWSTESCWNDPYEGTRKGWQTMLRRLKETLEGS